MKCLRIATKAIRTPGAERRVEVKKNHIVEQLVSEPSCNDLPARTLDHLTGSLVHDLGGEVVGPALLAV